MSRGHSAPTLYTTTVEAEKTAMEIVSRLGRHGARSVMIDWEQRGGRTGSRPAAIAFQVDTGEHGVQAFRLPVDVAAMERHLSRLHRGGDIAPRYASAEQAERTAWRLMGQWLSSQLSMVEAQQTTLAQTMLPFLLVSGTETLYDRFVASGLRELESGQVHDGTVVS